MNTLTPYYEAQKRRVRSAQVLSPELRAMPPFTPARPPISGTTVVPLSCSTGSVPHGFVRMVESNVPVHISTTQIDLVIDCYRRPRYWLQSSTPGNPEPPPRFTVRFTGSFPKADVTGFDVLRMLEDLIAADPHNFTHEISADGTMLLFGLPSFLLNASGEIADWTTDPSAGRA